MPQASDDIVFHGDTKVVKSNFQHDTLPEGSTWIRLLKVNGQTDDDHLDCDIFVHDLEQKIDFYAISYTWGHLYPQTHLRLNSQFWLDIRPNCAYVLKQVLLRYGPGTLVWIDAVCINQSDIHERSQQVSIMAVIYAKAVKVLACVGSHADDSRFLFDLLNRRNGRVSESWLSRNTTLRWSHRERLRLRAWLLSHSQEYTGRIANAVLAFLNRPYFTRVWVVQELFCSQSTDFLCDIDFVNSKHVYRLREALFFAPVLLFQSSMQNDESPSGFLVGLAKVLNRGIGHLYILRRMRTYRSLKNADTGKRSLHMEAVDKSSPLLDAIHITITDMTELDCEDPRDRIFAVSAITTSWPGWNDIRPDYSMAVEDLTVRVLQADMADKSSFHATDFEKRLVDALGLAANSVERVLSSYRGLLDSDPSIDPRGIEDDSLVLMWGLRIENDRSVPFNYNLNANDTAKKIDIHEAVFQEDKAEDIVHGYMRIVAIDHTNTRKWTLVLPNSFQTGDWIFVDQRPSSWTFAFLARPNSDSETFKVIDCCLLSPMQRQILVSRLFIVRGLRYIQKLGLEVLQAGTTAQQHELTNLQAVDLLSEAKLLSLDLWLEGFKFPQARYAIDKILPRPRL